MIRSIYRELFVGLYINLLGQIKSFEYAYS